MRNLYRKILTILAIVWLLYPILLGAIEAYEQQRRAMIQAMREEHGRRIAAQNVRLAARRAQQVEEERRRMEATAKKSRQNPR